MEEPVLSPTNSPNDQEKSRGPWLGLGIGFLIIVAIIGGLIYSSRTSETRYAPQPTPIQAAGSADPYAANLNLSDVHMSAAENMLGGNVTYVEGKVTNAGEKMVTGATVEVTFKNSLGQVVQRQTEPLWIVQRREPAVDVASLAVNPMKPGETREFQLSFEHISADWNRQFPELRITVVTTK
jgi:hypothetical protein